MGVIDEAECSINKLNYLKYGNSRYENTNASTVEELITKTDVKQECHQMGNENESKTEANENKSFKFLVESNRALPTTKLTTSKQQNSNVAFKKARQRQKKPYIPYSLRIKAQTSSSKTYKCKKCGLRAPSFSFLQKHEKHHTEPQKDYVYKCAYCNYSTGSKAYFEYHKQLHESKDGVKKV